MSEPTPPEPPRTTQINAQVTTGDVSTEGSVTGLNIRSIEAQNVTITTSGAAVSLPQVRPLGRAERSALIRTIRRIWIDGVLERSLWNNALVELQLSEQADRVVQPYGMEFQQSGAASQPAPNITATFRQYGSLLILGAPGSGKTTLLLELLHHVLGDAEQQPEQPIPIVLNLAGWARQQRPLVAWMADELFQQYGVNKKAAQTWLAAGALLPMLDGLDDVAEERRDDCARAINAYCAGNEHTAFSPLVVCCRSEEYNRLPELRLAGAVQLEPLSRAQIDGYLQAGGAALAGVRAVVQDDPTLYGLLQTPLMLSLTALTFADQPADALRRSMSPEARRDMMFDRFLLRQLAAPPLGKGPDARYGMARTIQWLHWLAQEMVEHKQVIFWMELLHLGWLAAAPQQRMLRAINSLLNGLVFGILFAALVWVAFGPLASLVIGLLGGGIAALAAAAAQPALPERLYLNWKNLRSPRAVGRVALATLVLGIGGWLVNWLLGADTSWRSGGAIFSALAGLAGGLFLELVDQAKIAERTHPNQGVHQAIWNLLISGACFGLLFSGISLLVFQNPVVVVFGLVFGLLFRLVFQNAVPRHYLLRLALALPGTFALNMAAFLDSCAQRRLVQRVGGGWRFPHAFLRNHLATLDVAAFLARANNTQQTEDA